MASPIQQPLARVRENADGSFSVQTVEEHARAVAHLAAGFAEPFGTPGWARLCGLWHDLGKLHPEFDKRIRTLSGYDPEAHLETLPGKPDHATLGAIHALEQFGEVGRVLAYPIAGHHTGLPDWEGGDARGGTLRSREKRQRARYEELDLTRLAPSDIREASVPEEPPPGSSPALWLRMLFSCLVDADRLDSERFMDPDRSRLRGDFADLATLKARLDDHLRELTARAPDSRVNQLRSEVLQACRAAGSDPPGLFSLTVPTGGGKTFSSLAWALDHAITHGLDRIIYVIPFTSIIEQTADEFRKALGDDAVLEHHSNLDPDRESLQANLAAENWDAPIVVTTGVQFWESLFSHKTSRARRIHRIVKGVVILDEAQTIPPAFLKPIFSVIRELADHYGTSFLLCTATQPAYDPRPDTEPPFEGLSPVRKIIPDPEDLAHRLRRVEVYLPDDLRVTVEWEDIAREIEQEDRVLCIVSRRDDARALYRLLPPDTREHLSALMCGEHRSVRIRKIKRMLDDGEPVRVVSTQLIEAGVDIDFPVVFRAFAGIDSIAQAAGRCNREGKLESGMVRVFVPPKPPPPGLLRQAADSARAVLERGELDPLTPEAARAFFAELYWKQGERLDKHGILDLLDHRGCLEIAFRSASERFRIIDDIHESIIVRYENDDLLDRLRFHEPDRTMKRRLQRYVVNVPKRIHAGLAARGQIEEVHNGIWVQADDRLYDEALGLMPVTDEVFDPVQLIA